MVVVLWLLKLVEITTGLLRRRRLRCVGDDIVVMLLGVQVLLTVDVFVSIVIAVVSTSIVGMSK